ncbi:hypothetical protein ABPG72_002405 [Tetrahymena utriculariae]
MKRLDSYFSQQIKDTNEKGYLITNLIKYRQINPGFFSIATFPFLLLVIFGEIGHGILLFTYGCYLMCTYDKKTRHEDQLYKRRYIISMMGFINIFCGFIYNDFMSIPLDLFGSFYNFQGKSKLKRKDEFVYHFGMDPEVLNHFGCQLDAFRYSSQGNELNALTQCS